MDESLALKGGTKWLPIPISKFETHLKQLIVSNSDFETPKCLALKKNVSYSLQHLEFLYRCDRDLEITSVIFTQNIKTIVIVGCGILEALFYYILVADGKASRTEWQSVSKIKSPEFEINGNKYRTDLEHFVKLAVPALDQMTFDAMCKRVEKRDLAKLGTDKFYKHLPFLRSLWNRVHIHDVDCMQDTDWIKFERKDFNLVKQVLFLLLQSPSFPIKNTDIFYFLKV